MLEVQVGERNNGGNGCEGERLKLRLEMKSWFLQLQRGAAGSRSSTATWSDNVQRDERLKLFRHR